MNAKTLSSVLAISIFIFINPLFAEQALDLPVKEGSHSVGHDQNTLGINAYKKKKFDQAFKHFQVASIVDRKRGEIFFIYLFPPLDTCCDLGFKILGVEFVEYFFQVDLATINKV